MKKIKVSKYVIFANDNDVYIPKILEETNDFYDIDNLKIVGEYINSDSVVLDIGANIGNHSIYFSQIAKEVHSFEPFSENYEMLQKNISYNKINNIFPYNYGISDKDEVKNASMQIDGNFGSLAVDENNNGISLVMKNGSNLNIKNVDFIKIDVEGFENVVLSSLKKLIFDSKCTVYIEINEKNIDYVFNFFHELGYELKTVDINLNCIFQYSTVVSSLYSSKKLANMTVMYNKMKKLSEKNHSAYIYEKNKVENSNVKLLEKENESLKKDIIETKVENSNVKLLEKENESLKKDIIEIKVENSNVKLLEKENESLKKDIIEIKVEKSNVKILEKENESLKKDIIEIKVDNKIKTNELQTDVLEKNKSIEILDNEIEKRKTEFLEMKKLSEMHHSAYLFEMNKNKKEFEILNNKLVEMKKLSERHHSAYLYEMKKSDIMKLESQLYRNKLHNITTSKKVILAFRIQNLSYKVLRKKLIPESFNKYDNNIKNIVKKEWEKLNPKNNQIKPKNIKKREFIVKPIEKMNVAVIMDEFSFTNFRSEFNAFVLTPENWKEIFENEDIDLFLCESAWSGVDSKIRPWKGKIYSSKNFLKENRIELLQIIEHCNEKQIKTIFWNKEDPTHFEDRTHNFVKTSDLFDYVFTTAVECLNKYKKRRNDDNVFVLPFACQPKISFPENKSRSSKISFFGSWYANHEIRSKEMEEIFDCLLEAGFEIDIFDRFYGTDDESHFYPEKYRKYVKPSIPFENIMKEYSNYNISLNINTVKESRTMLARRIFELAASKTLIISNDSLAIDTFFGEDVIILPRDIERLKNLTPLEKNQIIERNFEKAVNFYSYSNSFKSILKNSDIDFLEKKEKIIFKFINFKEAEKVIEEFSKKKFPDKILYLVYKGSQKLEFVKFMSNISVKNVNIVDAPFLEDYICDDYLYYEFEEIDSLNDINEISKYKYCEFGRISLYKNSDLSIVKKDINKSIVIGDENE